MLTWILPPHSFTVFVEFRKWKNKSYSFSEREPWIHQPIKVFGTDFTAMSMFIHFLRHFPHRKKFHSSASLYEAKNLYMRPSIHSQYACAVWVWIKINIHIAQKSMNFLLYRSFLSAQLEILVDFRISIFFHSFSYFFSVLCIFLFSFRAKYKKVLCLNVVLNLRISLSFLRGCKKRRRQQTVKRAYLLISLGTFIYCFIIISIIHSCTA